MISLCTLRPQAPRARMIFPEPEWLDLECTERTQVNFAYSYGIGSAACFLVFFKLFIKIIQESERQGDRGHIQGRRDEEVPRGISAFQRGRLQGDVLLVRRILPYRHVHEGR